MRVCEQTATTAPERKLRYSDLKPGDVFRWAYQVGVRAEGPYSVKDAAGHTYLTLSGKGTRYIQSHLIDRNEAVVLYPDVCLDPGEAVTTMSGL